MSDERFTTDAQLAEVAAKWPTSVLVGAIGIKACILMSPYSWNNALTVRCPGIERLGKGDLTPMFAAAEAELNKRIPVPTR